MKTPEASLRLVSCPACGGDAVYGPQNAFRPFCSERCRSIDLGAWASEGYRVPAAPADPGRDEGDPPPAAH